MGRGYEYRTADFVESKAGALKPKHCETDVADSVSEERGGGGGGAQVGPRKLPLAGRNRRPPSILCSGRGIGLAPLSLKAGRCIFSRGGQQEKCIFPPATFQRKVDAAGIFYGRGGSIWRSFWAGLHTMSSWVVFIPRTLVYSSQGEPRHRSTFNGRPLWTATPTDRSTI